MKNRIVPPKEVLMVFVVAERMPAPLKCKASPVNDPHRSFVVAPDVPVHSDAVIPVSKLSCIANCSTIVFN